MADQPPCLTDKRGLPVMTWSVLSQCADIPIPCWTLLNDEYRSLNGTNSYRAKIRAKKANPYKYRDLGFLWDFDEKADRQHYSFVQDSRFAREAGHYEQYQFGVHQ